MGYRRTKFINDSVIAYDKRHHSTLYFNISKYDESVQKGKSRYDKFGEARQYASDIKDHVISALPEYLEQFENNIKARGAEVLWARDSSEALGHIERVLLENKAQLVVKSKSMISEEILFNEHCRELGIEALETDLGEFIVQTDGQKPYHILTPAMHKSKEDVAELFHRKFGTPPHSSPADIAAFVRDFLREKFIHADVGVTGANFLVADTGAIGLTENEGNGLMTVSFPRIHIVLAGIERVIPSIRHIPFFWQWLGVHGTGQNISAYNTLLTGPRQPGEMDGPEKMVVILLDNGRSEVYNDPDARAALKCIRCGACLNACPVYRHIGGYTYGSTYTGPIGSVLTPFLSGFKEYGHLSEASTLCGRCSDVCPVKIPLHDLLLLNRQRNVAQHGSGLLWRAGMKAFVFTFGNRERVDFFNGKFKRRLARIVGNPLGKGKKIPRFADHSFSRNWKLQNL